MTLVRWKQSSIFTIFCLLPFYTLIGASHLKKSYRYPRTPSTRPSGLATKPTNRPATLSVSSKPTSKPQLPLWASELPTKVPVKPTNVPVSSRVTVKPKSSIPVIETTKPTSGKDYLKKTNMPTLKEDLISSSKPWVTTTSSTSWSPTTTFQPSNRAMLLPTAPDSNQTSNATLEICKSSSNGDYGMKTASSVYVSYNYQIQVPQTADVGQLVGKLERKVTDLILPSLFSSKCASRNQRWLESIGSNVVGLSALPDDIVTVSNDCVYVPIGARCYYVKGRLTLFVLANSTQAPGDRRLDIDGPLIAEVSALVVSTIQEAMDTGTLLVVDNQIKALQYVGSNEDKVIVLTSSQPDPFPTYGIILIVLLFVLMAILLVRRTRNNPGNNNLKETNKVHHLNGDAHSLNTYEDINGDADIEALNRSDHDDLIHHTRTEYDKNGDVKFDEYQINQCVISNREDASEITENNISNSLQNIRITSPPLIDDHSQHPSDLSFDVNSVSSVLINDNISEQGDELDTLKSSPTSNYRNAESLASKENNKFECAMTLCNPTLAENARIMISNGEVTTSHAPYDEKAVDHVDIFVEETSAQDKVNYIVRCDTVPPYDEEAFDGAIAFFRRNDSDSVPLYTGNNSDKVYDVILPLGDEVNGHMKSSVILEEPSQVMDTKAYVCIEQEERSNGSDDR